MARQGCKASTSWPAALLAGLALGLIVALAAACGGEGGETGGPRLAMKGDSFDLGRVPVGKQWQLTVPFENQGDAPLTVEITSVRPAPRSACGCGIQDFSVDRPEVPPGEEGNLMFTLKAPEGASGAEDVMLVELQTNDPKRPQRTITIKFKLE